MRFAVGLISGRDMKGWTMAKISKAPSDGVYAVLPLRDIVVFPHMIVPLFVGREKSIKALEEVMGQEKQILLDTMFELPALEGVREVVISEEVVTGSARPLYIYSEQKEKKGNVSA